MAPHYRLEAPGSAVPGSAPAAADVTLAESVLAAADRAGFGALATKLGSALWLLAREIQRRGA